METHYREEYERLQIYVKARGAVLTERFGSGQDGLVYATNRESAVKCLRFAKLFKNERDVYLRLAAHECDEIAGFAVPRMIDSDDELWIVEMQIVSPPFIVDFAGASLDIRPRILREMSVEDWTEWQEERIEMFGDDWPKVEAVMAELRKMGIYLSDVKPGNITVRNR